MRFSPVQLDYFPLQGGMDQVTPPLSIPPGHCRESQNYEIGVNGGYRRIDGYERFDGRPSPADAIYYMLPVTISGTVAVGDTITGATSGASGKVIAVEASAIAFTKWNSTQFQVGENVQVGGVTQAVVTAVQITSGASTEALNRQYLALAAGVYRSDITAVPGSGSILGVWYYNGVAYAFRNHTDGLTAKLWKSTTGGWVEVVTGLSLNPNGRYEFQNYNFGTGVKMYGCDGENKAFQFDGTTFTQITTGMTPDTPDHIALHKNHLFLAFDNSLQHSAIGDPTSWTPVLGAGELNIGDTITNLLPQPGDAQGAAMAVYGRNGTFMLYGTSSTDWNLVTVQADIGAFPYTAQYLGTTFVLDDRGVTTLQTTQQYGNFTAAAISKLVRPYIVENKSRVVASGVSRDKNQYRLFFNGGRALYFTLQGGFMLVQFPIEVTCYTAIEDSNGNEIALFGSDDGYVYQNDKGVSFDGTQIESFLNLVFNHTKSPRLRKFYRKAVVEVSGEGYATFWMSADLSYGSTDVDQIELSQVVAQLSSGRWDSGVWDAGVWDGRILAPAEFELTGTAENIALKIAQVSDYEAPLTFYGVLVHYTPRRQLR